MGGRRGAEPLDFAVLDLVTALGDGVADAALPQLASCAGMTVGLVGQQVLGSVTGLSEGVEQRNQARVVPCLTG